MDHAHERSSHIGKVPKGGGIGILGALFLSALWLEIPTWFWLPPALLSLVSFYGDRQDISPGFRLGIQILCAGAALYHYEGFTSDSGHIFVFLVLVLFIVGTCNINNFMDGINGIAGINAIVVSGLMCVYLWLNNGQEEWIIFLGTISVSTIPFLFFNLPKAKVFMGDVGSILIGFVLAELIVFSSKNIIDFICMAGFLIVYYIDEVTTMIIRIRDRESLFKAHRKHIYQLLANEMGYAHWKVASGYGIVQLVIGVAVLSISSYGVIALVLLYSVIGTLLIYLSVKIRRAVK